MRPLLALAVALLPAVPLAQSANLDDPDRLPAIALPNVTVAGGEEPAALQLNPAAPGFVGGPSLQYFHEDRTRGRDVADEVFLTLPLGGLVPSLALEWTRPGDLRRFRRTTFGLALSNGRSVSLGGTWTQVHSPDPDLDRVESFGAGLTLRPRRWLSVAAAATDLDARLAGRAIPARFALGAAVRTWRDRLTLSTDLLATDEDGFDPAGLAFGAHVELLRGIALSAQVQAPLRGGAETVGLLALTLDAPHSGVTAAAAADAARGARWLVGARSSAEAYRAPRARRDVSVDLREELTPSFSLLAGPERDPYGKLLSRLRQLRDDPSVGGVAVTIDDLDLGLGRTGEVRRALAELAATKDVVAYVRGGRIAEYWLATAADRVYSPPAAELEVGGLASSTPFLREGLAKIGVAFEVVAAGRYKSAPDPLVRREMSDAQREAADALLDELFARIVRDVAAARQLPEDRVRALVERGLFTSTEAAEARLLDGIAWPDELAARLRPGARSAPLPGYARPRGRRAQRWGSPPVIAVIPVEGAIVQGRSRRSPVGGPFAGAESIVAQLRRAADDRSVRAIVLRVDSPGGDALASDLIGREVARARARGKPVVASLGDAAASGGYLVAVAADEIVSEPSTLTGSIGVFAVKPDFSGLLGRIGVNVVTLRRGEHADLRSSARPWTADERALVERQIAAFYDAFKLRVADGRRLPADAVERVAQGRVWTGAQAKERGLVDRLGTFADAVERAMERAGLRPDDEVALRRFEPPRRLFEGIARFAAGAPEPDLQDRLVSELPELRTAAAVLEMGRIVALPVEWLDAPPVD
jgi:protease-4